MSIVLDGTAGITSPAETIQGNLTTTGNTILGDASTDTLNVGNGGLIKDATGNVGVGVTPNTWYTNRKSVLSFGGSDNVASLNFAKGTCETLYNCYFDAAGSTIYQQTNYAGYSDFNNTVAGGFAWKTAPSGTAGASGTLTTRMTLDVSGNLGIGNSSMSSFGAAYQTLVVGSGAGNQGMTIFAGPTSYSAYLAYKSAANSTTQGLTYYDFSNNRYYCTSVSAGVYLASGGTSWTSASDERVKDIIEPIENAAEKVSTLRSVIGKYKTDEEGTRRSFLIAQDVQAVLPEAVDATNPDELGVNYTEVIPLLVAAIKELKAEIDLLKASK